LRRRFMTRFRTVSTVLVIALLGLGSGCLSRSPDVRHFVLGTTHSTETSARAPEMALLIGPVRLPAYLERPQIATLEDGGEVELDEFNRWLGGFEENFLRALSLGLAQELGSDRVVAGRSKAPFEIDYQVRLHIDDMIVVEGSGLRVRVRWGLISLKTEAAPQLFVMDELVALAGSSQKDLVRAHEAAVMELVRRIADQVEGGPSNPS
jgi:uncharacterized lipoprotein YmbA